jgi:MoaA/NifB/PqqE/SkfB family radical SAM enzyme
MCNVWHNPTIPGNEIRPEDIEKLPSGLRFVNITGGEPFMRRDISEVIEVVRKKTKRIVISTNGFFTDRIVELCKKYKGGFQTGLTEVSGHFLLYGRWALRILVSL